MDLTSQSLPPNSLPNQNLTPSSLSYALYTRTPPPPPPPQQPFMTLSTPMSEIVPVLRPSVNNLDSLVTFYQQERMWVYRTRVELQDVEDEDEHSPPLPNSPPSPSISHEPPIRPSRRSSSPTRWTRRKKGLKLNPSSSRRSLQTSMDAAHNPAIRVLDMYESIMQSRMESCERINRLIRNANRTHLSRVPKRSHYAERRISDYSSDEYQ